MFFSNLIKHQSIVLEKLYNLCFESDSIGWSIRPQMNETQSRLSLICGQSYNQMDLDSKEHEKIIKWAIVWCTRTWNSTAIEGSNRRFCVSNNSCCGVWRNLVVLVRQLLAWKTVTVAQSKVLKCLRSQMQPGSWRRISSHVQLPEPSSRMQNLPPNRYMPSTLPHAYIYWTNRFIYICKWDPPKKKRENNQKWIWQPSRSMTRWHYHF